jgi:phosphoribosylformimino-5-aminoimidazole carboxamide ribotide isomerase
VLIPSIDLQGGRVVQLEQGERLKIASDDVQGWVRRFAGFPVVQLIDLDAAKGVGNNDGLVREVCAQLPCQVGGGVRTPERARALLEAGARRVIVGSALFSADGVDTTRAAEFSAAIGADAFIAAIDARGGRVAVHGWRSTVDVTPADAAAALDPYCGAFLFTNVDTEGLLGGFPIDRLTPLLAATRRRLIAAGGIRSREEIDALDAMGVDAVVGMAIYRGVIVLGSPPR